MERMDPHSFEPFDPGLELRTLEDDPAFAALLHELRRSSRTTSRFAAASLAVAVLALAVAVASLILSPIS